MADALAMLASSQNRQSSLLESESRSFPRLQVCSAPSAVALAPSPVLASEYLVYPMCESACSAGKVVVRQARLEVVPAEKRQVI